MWVVTVSMGDISGTMCADSASTCAVATSMLDAKTSTWAVAAFVWDLEVSSWAVTGSIWDVAGAVFAEDRELRRGKVAKKYLFAR